jgi:oligopeptide/dipeptide ABC transporter ATP-binding protein
VEDQPAAGLLRDPRHPYTKALLGCYADPRAEEVSVSGIPGTPPDLADLPGGCSFAPRCPLAEPACRAAEPPLADLGADAAAACVVAAREGAR